MALSWGKKCSICDPSAPSLPYLSQCSTRKESPDFLAHGSQTQVAVGLGGGGGSRGEGRVAHFDRWAARRSTAHWPGTGIGSPLSHIARVANKLDHVVEVELVALGEAVDWVAWVSTGNCCNRNRRESALLLFPNPSLSCPHLTSLMPSSDTALGLTLVSLYKTQF